LGDFPGTEPVREKASASRTGEVPPPPEGVPLERAGEIPTAEEFPPPRAEEVPREEGSSGAPPPGAQRASLDPQLSEEEMVRRQAVREWGGADKGLTDEVEDATFGEEKRRGRTDREERR